MDVRPSKRFKLSLPDIDFDQHSQLKTEIVTSQLVILYFLSDLPIKVTLYTSGRMLVDNRDEKLVRSIVQVVISNFP